MLSRIVTDGFNLWPKYRSNFIFKRTQQKLMDMLCALLCYRENFDCHFKIRFRDKIIAVALKL